MTGIELIAYERAHQIHKFGYTSEHDSQYEAEVLCNAAIAYLQPWIGGMEDDTDEFMDNEQKVEARADYVYKPSAWPFITPWKGGNDDRITQLAKAGAFIAAEIDRILKTQHEQSKQSTMEQLPKPLMEELIEKIENEYPKSSDTHYNFTTKDLREAATKYAKLAIEHLQKDAMQWVSVETPPENGMEVFGFNPSWIDEDYSLDGVCMCFMDDEGMWTITKWCGYHDDYHTYYSVKWGDGEIKVAEPPTHWLPKTTLPAPPITTKQQ